MKKNIEEKQEASKSYDSGGMHAHMILLVCSLLYMINFMDRQVLSVVLEPMKLDIGLSDTQAGIIQTVFMLSIAFFAFPSAILVDRWSRRKAMGIMAIFWSLFTFLTGTVRSFSLLLIPRALVGVGEAGFSSAGTAMITAAYPKKTRGLALGIFAIAIPLGSALGMILGGHISANYGGWRTPFYVFAVPGILLGICSFFLRDYKTAKKQENDSPVAGIISNAKHLMKTPTLFWLYTGFTFHNMMSMAFLVWIPAFLMRAQGISEDKAGIMIGIIALSAMVGAPLGGWLADFWQKSNKRGRMLVPALSDFLAAILIIAATLLNLEGVGFAIAIGYGIIHVCSLPALQAVTQDVVPPWMKGTSWSLAQFFMYIPLGCLAPTAVGIISDAVGGGVYGLKVALIIMSLGGFVGALCFFISSKHYFSDSEKVKQHVLEME